MPQVPEADLVEELALARRELAEALERQAATDEVLRVISTSPSELARVFRTMLENATRICEANFGNLYVCDGDVFRLTAAHNTPAAMVDARQRAPIRARAPHMRRMLESKQDVHIADLSTEEGYIERLRRPSPRSNSATSGPSYTSRWLRTTR